MRRFGTFVLAFTLGACATAAVSSVAAVQTPTQAVKGASASGAIVRDLRSAPLRVSPSGTAAVSLLARGEEAFIGLLRMDAEGQVPTHRDATEEFIYVLEGGGMITIDGEEHALREGTVVYMPANAEVSFENGPVPLVAIQVFAGPAPADKYDSWSDQPVP